MSTLSTDPNRHDTENQAEADAWGATAQDYSQQITRLTALYAHDLIRLLHPYMANAKLILDVGCGAGAFVHAYRQQYPRGIPGQTICSTDRSPAMLEQARRSTAHLGERPAEFATQLVFQPEDGTTLEGIADGSVDIVVSLYAVFLIPDQTATLQSIRRVLRPETGVFANAAWTVPSHAMDPTFGGNFQLAFQQAMAVMSSTSPSTGQEEASPVVLQQEEHPYWQWNNPDQIARNLTQQQFGSTQVHRMFHSMVWSNFETLFDLVCQNPMISVTPETSEEQLLLLRNTLLEFSVPLLEEERQRFSETNDFRPLVLWTSSNLSVTYASNRHP